MRHKAVVALSGGPDSLALLALAARSLGRAHTRALVVDHAIAPWSAKVAQKAATTARSLVGVNATVVHSPARTRSQLNARSARYTVLQSLRQADETLLIGTHANDCAETLLMRLCRGSTLRGLGVHRPSTRGSTERNTLARSDHDCMVVRMMEDVRHAVRSRPAITRPLCGWNKAELMQICDHLDLPYFDDPANTSDVYARSFARRALARGSARGGVDTADALRVAQACSKLRDCIDARAGSIVNTCLLTRLHGSLTSITFSSASFQNDSHGVPDAVIERAVELMADMARNYSHINASSANTPIGPNRRRGKAHAREVATGSRRAALFRKCLFKADDVGAITVSPMTSQCQLNVKATHQIETDAVGVRGSRSAAAHSGTIES